MLSRRRFLQTTPPFLAALVAAPHLCSAASALGGKGADKSSEARPPEVGFSTRAGGMDTLKPVLLTSASAQVCRILQFTDLHFFQKTAAEDQRTVDDIKRHIDLQHPDLIAVTGDIWHENPNGRGEKGLALALSTFSSCGVPWANSWGNHDRLTDYQAGHDALEAARGSAYRGGATRGDYRVEVRRPGSDASVALDLFFLNGTQQGVGPWQVASLQAMGAQVGRRGGKAVASLGFFHIPVFESESRLTAENFRGIKLEGIGKVPEVPSLFPTFASLKNLRASFCGHCHCNDCTVKLPEGDLVYGRATGYAGYGGETVRKGAKLIEVDLVSGLYKAMTVFADGSKNFA